jgi:hypothetical protein
VGRLGTTHADGRKSRAIDAAALALDISPKTIWTRLHLGWTWEKALTEPRREIREKGRKPNLAAIKAMYERGMTGEQIASDLGKDRYDVFEWLHEAGTKMRKNGKPQKLPDARTLRRLYVQEGKTTLEIAALYGCSSHKTVTAALDRARIPVRKSGTRKKEHCVKCWRPIHRIYHRKFRCWYGTMCKMHRKIHRVNRAKWYTRETRNIHWTKWRYQADIPEEVKRTEEYQTFIDEERELQCLKEAKESLRVANKWLRHRGFSLSLRVG